MDFRLLPSALVKPLGCSGAPSNIAVEFGGSMKFYPEFNQCGRATSDKPIFSHLPSFFVKPACVAAPLNTCSETRV